MKGPMVIADPADLAVLIYALNSGATIAQQTGHHDLARKCCELNAKLIVTAVTEGGARLGRAAGDAWDQLSKGN